MQTTWTEGCGYWMSVTQLELWYIHRIHAAVCSKVLVQPLTCRNLHQGYVAVEQSKRLKCCQKTEHTALRHSLRTAVFKVRQEIPCLFVNPKFHKRVQWQTTTAPIKSRLDLWTFTLGLSVWFTEILTSRLRLYLPSGLFRSGLPTKILYVFHPAMLHGVGPSNFR